MFCFYFIFVLRNKDDYLLRCWAEKLYVVDLDLVLHACNPTTQEAEAGLKI